MSKRIMITAKLIDFIVESYQWKVLLNVEYEKKLKKMDSKTSKLMNIDMKMQFLISNLSKIFFK